MHEQARPLIHSRDSPASSRFECGLAHACVAIIAACMHQLDACVVMYMCLHVGLLATHSGLPQDNVTFLVSPCMGRSKMPRVVYPQPCFNPHTHSALTRCDRALTKGVRQLRVNHHQGELKFAFTWTVQDT